MRGRFRLAFWVFELGKIGAVLFIIALILHYFVLRISGVSGGSMEPNFKDGEFVLVDQISYRFAEPKRGDVVILKFPGQPKEKYIKRIIGLPFETISIKDGFVYINDKKLNERYLPFGRQTSPEMKITLGKEEYFLLGDNRENSNDSRFWGPCPKNYILGRAIFILWPISDWNIVPRPAY